jgi:hypothetical protein
VSILQRIASRAALGLWAQKQTLAGGVAIVAALAAYLAFFEPPFGTEAASEGRDCADTVMAALANSGGTSGVQVQQQAYQCMDPTFQQQVSQQQFTSRLQVSTAGRTITRVARVGSYDAPSGTELVYYAVDAGNQSVGFVIYLGDNGKVLNIE